MKGTGGGGLSPVKQALVEIRRLKQELQAERRRRTEPIAVVGMGVRAPGQADSVEAFGRALFEGVDAVGPFPEGRWSHADFYAPDSPEPGKYYIEEGGFLDSVDAFDPEFFGIAPLEATTMDPQQRLLLETVWESLEHAGIPATALKGSRSGVFVGIGTTDYHRAVLAEPGRIDTYASTGTAFSVASGRIAYLLGLQGPAVSVDTACSSSLVAIHLASQSLRSGESDLALAAGVNLILSPEITINFCQAGMLSRDGRCRTFDAGADGYVRSEGCGVVVLKRLSDAQRDGDRILAVVRGSAMNQDGRSSGLTAPSGPAQEAVVRSALAQAGLRPADIGYVEAHGTGTSLGDPIEMQALGAVFSDGPRERPLLVGSVKTNLGHLEAAAGIVGFIKTVLALRQREIPPHLHLTEPNPHIDWDRMPVTIPTTRTPFQPTNGARRAGISSFGFSGTNAHVILEEAPAAPQVTGGPDRPVEILTLSAPHEGALRELASRYARHLGESTDAFADICHTAKAGRAHFGHRLALLARDAEGARASLDAWIADGQGPRVRTGAPAGPDRPGVAFVFPDGGAPWAGVAWSLFEGSPVAREALERCGEVLREHMDVPLLEVIDPTRGNEVLVDRPEHHEPGLFALHYALSELWRSWGIEADVVTGADVGEYAAARVAGILSLEDAARLAATRGRLLAGIEAGKPEAEAVRELEAVLGSVELRAAEDAVFVSASTGAAVSPADLAQPAYWTAQLRAPARLGAAVGAAAAEAAWFIEMGVSGGGAPWAEALTDRSGTIRVSGPGGGASPWPALLDGLARLYTAGADVDWNGLDRGFGRNRVALPTYPFQRRRFWLESWGSTKAGAAAPSSDDAASPWESARGAALQRADVAPLDVNIAAYGPRWEALAELSAGLGRNALAALGAFPEAGVTRDLEGVLEATGIGRIYAPPVKRWLEALAEAGALERTPEGYRSPEPLSTVDLSEQWARVEALLADDLPLLRYIRHAGSLVTDVLAGRTSALETLFPDGSFELASDLYERAGLLRYVNGIAASALEGYVRGRPTDAPIRVLEVGAGTGGTTSSLVSVLPRDRATYDYTDVSDIFLEFGQEKFSSVPFLRTRRFDLEGDPAEQDMEPGSYDVIVGSNVLHAVRDLRATLARVRSLLAPGGLLLLVESTGHHAWHDFTTGLIEGWQHFEDDIRKDTPLLDVETWRGLLEEAGFQAVEGAPLADSPAAVLKQHVLLAVAPEEGDAVPAAPVADGQREERADTAPEAPAEPVLADRLAGAVGNEQEEMVTEVVRACVMEILRADPDRPPSRDARLMELGVDSLMAVRLRNLLQKKLGLGDALPSTLIFDYPTIRQISKHVISVLGQHEGADGAGAGGAKTGLGAGAAEGVDAAEAERERSVAALSDAEVEALLLDRLDAEDA